MTKQSKKEREEKLIGIFRLKLNGVFEPFNVYGMHVHIPDAAEEIVKLTLRLHQELKEVQDERN